MTERYASESPLYLPTIAIRRAFYAGDTAHRPSQLVLTCCCCCLVPYTLTPNPYSFFQYIYIGRLSTVPRALAHMLLLLLLLSCTLSPIPYSSIYTLDVFQRSPGLLLTWRRAARRLSPRQQEDLAHHAGERELSVKHRVISRQTIRALFTQRKPLYRVQTGWGMYTLYLI